VNESLVYPESFVNMVDLLNKLLLLWCCVICTQTNLHKNWCKLTLKKKKASTIQYNYQHMLEKKHVVSLHFHFVRG